MRRFITALVVGAAISVLAGCGLPEKDVQVESKVYGFDGSLPVPGFSGAENIVNMRFGAIVTRYQSHPKDSKASPYMSTEYDNISLWSLSGGGKTYMRIGMPSSNDSTDTNSTNEVMK